ncbi:hypothetical protein BCR44DRAFT_1446935, partial [Catenaria anguillulae PL171]
MLDPDPDPGKLKAKWSSLMIRVGTVSSAAASLGSLAAATVDVNAARFDNGRATTR